MEWSVSGKGWLTIKADDQTVHVCLSKVRQITEFKATDPRSAFIRITYDDGSRNEIDGSIDLDLGLILFG